MRKDWDVVIAGAGPAGLSAALVLGRACRSVLLCDTGTPRSWASKEMHAFLSRDGIVPRRFLDLARKEVLKYRGVRFAQVEVRAARHAGLGFSVQLGKLGTVRARKLLIATGVYDLLPPCPASSHSTAVRCTSARTAMAGRCAENASLYMAASNAASRWRAP